MKDFLGNRINTGDEIVMSAYGELRTLRKGRVLELIEDMGYVRMEFESPSKSSIVDVIQPQYIVVVSSIINHSQTEAKTIFDLMGSK